jgi:hypothetical protein
MRGLLIRVLLYLTRLLIATQNVGFVLATYFMFGHPWTKSGFLKHICVDVDNVFHHIEKQHRSQLVQKSQCSAIEE